MNTFLDLAPKILSQALITLRENAIMPRLVNFDYSNDAKSKGAVIQVPVPSAMSAVDVVPAAYSQNTPDLTLPTVPIPLNYWKEAAFQISDKEAEEIMSGVPSMQIVEAARAIANEVDRSLIGLYKGVYNYAGTAGTTPFASDLSAVLAARKQLNNNNALLNDRRVVLNTDAEANALGLPAFQQYLQAGTDVTIREGQIGRKLGMDWFLDQNLPTFTAGNFASGTVKTTALPQATTTADASNPQQHNPRTVYSVAVDSAGNAATAKLGDVFTVAGDSQTYVVTADVTSAASGTASAQTAVISFSPAPKVQWTVGSVLTFKASRAVNLVFHRDAFALAVRPLDTSNMDKELGGAQFMTMVDPLTGIPLRLEIRREYKRIRWSLDCLWGVGLIRPETACVLAG
jgi:P22 coat protein - gene protein 5